MIAGNLRRLPRSDQARQLQRERRERAETGHWKVFHLPSQPNNYDYVVRNADSGSTYRVAWEPSLDLAACTCEDYRNTCQKFGITCKHIESVKIHQRTQGRESLIPLAGEVVIADGRYLVRLGAGNGRLVNHHPRQGCSCFLKTFCHRTGQQCLHGTTLSRWIEAGLVSSETPLDAPVVRVRVAALPTERPWGEWRVYEGALSRAWSVLPAGSQAYVVDNGGKDVPHQVVLADREGACSCGKFYQTGLCDHVGMVRDAVRGRAVLRPRYAAKGTRTRKGDLRKPGGRANGERSLP